MARRRRFTVRLDEKEFAALNRYADQKHVAPSAALRALIELCPALVQARRDDGVGQNSGGENRS